jgi:hypothetical protein
MAILNRFGETHCILEDPRVFVLIPMTEVTELTWRNGVTMVMISPLRGVLSLKLLLTSWPLILHPPDIL